jgi:tetratricopeptide (TPR) repeat protein/transcriptional regulator with XRE-family HTH domain
VGREASVDREQAPGTGFANLLRQLRAEAGLTQEELAEAAGLSPRTVSDLERGLSQTARKRTAILLADVMELTGQARVLFVAAGRGRVPAAEVQAARTGDAPLVLTAAALLDRQAPATATVPAHLVPVPRELPADVAAFTGRVTELAALSKLLSASGGGTIPGPVLIAAASGTAGVGKSALVVHWAHQVADQFPDGQLYVNLRGYDPGRPMPPADALAGFLRALGVPRQDIPARLEERAARYRSLLAGRRMVVVLDNAGEAEQVRPLLPGAPGCVVAVTSRDALAGLVARDGAIPVMLDLLPHDDAAALLTGLIGDRAAADPDTVARLAACCCRLPLALRVAAELATALPAVPLAVLAGELEQRQRRLDLLEAGGDSQASVREVFSWSVRHLHPMTAHAFTLAALHPGPDLDSWALAAMAEADQQEADRMLRELARAHLVQPAGTSRYTMHDLLRAFGRELAAQDHAGTGVRAAMTGLFTYLQGTAAAATDILYPAEPGERPWMPTPAVPLPPFTGEQPARAWLDAERETLIAATIDATSGGSLRDAVTLASIVHPYLDAGGYFAEAVAIHDSALRAAELASDPHGQARAQLHLGHIYRRQSRYQRALHHFERTLVLARQTEDRSTEYHVLFGLAMINLSQGRYLQASGYYRQILDLGQSTGSRYLQIRGLFGLGIVAVHTGRYRQAARQLQRAADICRATGELTFFAATLIQLGYLHLLQGSYRQAAEHLEQSAAICRDTGNQVAEAYAACYLAVVGLRQDQYGQPETQLREVLARFRANGNRHGQAEALTYLGELQLRTARCQHARRDLERALAICDQTGELAERAAALNLLGEVFLADGDPAQACTRHLDALTLARQLGEPYQQAHAHRGLGNAETALGHQAQGRQHREQALARYAKLGSPEADLIRTQLAATDWETPSTVTGSAPALAPGRRLPGPLATYSPRLLWPRVTLAGSTRSLPVSHLPARVPRILQDRGDRAQRPPPTRFRSLVFSGPRWFERDVIGRRKARGDPLKVIAGLLYGNASVDEWKATGPPADQGEPWSSFDRARQLVHAGRQGEAVEIWQQIVDTEGLGSRRVLQAWHFLRQAGCQPQPEKARLALGTVAEMPMQATHDVLAAYRDGTARYLNHSGKAVIWEGRTHAGVQTAISDWLATGQLIADTIGTSDQPVLPPLPAGHMRLVTLTPAGLCFGQGPADSLSNERLASPFIAAATRLMQLLTTIAAGEA